MPALHRKRRARQAVEMKSPPSATMMLSGAMARSIA